MVAAALILCILLLNLCSSSADVVVSSAVLAAALFLTLCSSRLDSVKKGKTFKQWMEDSASKLVKKTFGGLFFIFMNLAAVSLYHATMAAFLLSFLLVGLSMAGSGDASLAIHIPIVLWLYFLCFRTAWALLAAARKVLVSVVSVCHVFDRLLCFGEALLKKATALVILIARLFITASFLEMMMLVATSFGILVISVAWASWTAPFLAYVWVFTILVLALRILWRLCAAAVRLYMGLSFIALRFIGYAGSSLTATAVFLGVCMKKSSSGLTRLVQALAKVELNSVMRAVIIICCLVELLDLGRLAVVSLVVSLLVLGLARVCSVVTGRGFIWASFVLKATTTFCSRVMQSLLVIARSILETTTSPHGIVVTGGVFFLIDLKNGRLELPDQYFIATSLVFGLPLLNYFIHTFLKTASKVEASTEMPSKSKKGYGSRSSTEDFIKKMREPYGYRSSNDEFIEKMSKRYGYGSPTDDSFEKMWERYGLRSSTDYVEQVLGKNWRSDFEKSQEVLRSRGFSEKVLEIENLQRPWAKGVCSKRWQAMRIAELQAEVQDIMASAFQLKCVPKMSGR